MALTPNQIAALPVPDRIFDLQTIAGNVGEQYKAFICYGCQTCEFYAEEGSYPHFLSMEIIQPKILS